MSARTARDPVPTAIPTAERLRLVETLFSAPIRCTRSMYEIATDLSRGNSVSRDEVLEFMLAFNHPKPNWIPCSERMPEANTRVLIWWIDGVNCATLYGSVWETDEGNFPEVGSVTHWMPLPEPPEDP